jgi:hypothetical protein
MNKDVQNFIIQREMERKFSFLIKEHYGYILEELFESCKILILQYL